MSLTQIIHGLGFDWIAVLFWVAMLLTIMTAITIFAHLPYKITLGLFSILAWFVFGFARMGAAIFKMFKIFDNPIAVTVASCGVTLLIIFWAHKKFPRKKK